MQYNLEIRNEGALPAPYTTTVGGNVINVNQIYKDRPLLCNVIFICGTEAGQLRVHCSKNDFIIGMSPDVHIRFLGNERPPEVEKKA